MALRNFYIRGSVDGRETSIGFGPRAKDGGMNLELLIRNNGNSESILGINCYVDNNGKLIIKIEDKKTGDIIYNIKRDR